MYQKYYTDAFVLSHADRGEADRLVALYTKDFGAVRARSSAVRREASRMRFGLQRGAFSRIALVRGKAGWRLAGASTLAAFSSDTLEAHTVFARVTSLVERLTAGEEAHAGVFDALFGAHRALAACNAGEYDAVELLCVARVLSALGYFPSTSYELPGSFSDYSPAHLPHEGHRTTLVQAVNRAIAASAL